MQFLCTVLQMEADRIHFMLVSYHRIRLKKIERFAAHLVFSGEGERRCSNHEMTFLNGYIDLLNSHLHTSFLSQLPSRMQKWIDPANPHKVRRRGATRTRTEERSVWIAPCHSNAD